MTVSVKAATTRIVVGPQNLLTRNGITYNDRTQIECYRVDDFTGFERPDFRLPTEQNPQDDGETALPPSRGGRTMTMTGEIVAGSWTKAIEMSADLEDSLIDLIEYPLVIKAQPGSTYFTQPDVQIACRPSDFQIEKKVKAADRQGMFRRAFTVALRASKPRYLSSALHVINVPQVTPLTFPGGGGGLTFPVSGGILFPYSVLINNAGNWSAEPVWRFTGPQDGIFLYNDNGQSLALNGPIAPGQWIDVDVENGQVLDTNGANAFSQFDTTSDWVKLEGKRSGSTGDNKVALTTTVFGGGAAVTCSYRDSWM
jgi:hypothetical protein